MKTFIIAWIPDIQAIPNTSAEVIKIGGRIIEQQLSKLDAEKVEKCLKINGEGLSGDYITIADSFNVA